LGTLVYVSILLMAFAAAADILGLSSVRAALWSVLGYLPRLGAGLAVLAVGGYVARPPALEPVPARAVLDCKGCCREAPTS
jgi:hypothetical protein